MSTVPDHGLKEMVPVFGPEALGVGADGSFAFTGLRDRFYQLALLPPPGTGVPQLARMTVKGDPGVFALTATQKAKNVGAIVLTY